MGQQIKLNQFATVTEGSGPSQLERRDKTASVTVKGQNVGILNNCITMGREN
jgi:HAE1 family hydrophobic/amphiphilic exporter-1